MVPICHYYSHLVTHTVATRETRAVTAHRATQPADTEANLVDQKADAEDEDHLSPVWAADTKHQEYEEHEATSNKRTSEEKLIQASIHQLTQPLPQKPMKLFSHSSLSRPAASFQEWLSLSIFLLFLLAHISSYLFTYIIARVK